ncbi:MBL fold metallo-hydrolase [Ahrensia sp. 13_GOM-1096m]|uniref:MBL fold metallo-hydrolase n=1 Tax=Ahrensia sp. 13_GOM-1096m TaxID=1380380 RepID=UPI00047D1104|nr:MBL fold metallo-hydrolase [Ahrensia sp. 13_GOM-1096m]
MVDKDARLQVTILGCGSSPGVPRLNGDWGNCDPNNTKNNRLRAAALIERIAENGDKTVVCVDTGPDFRAQMIAAQVQQLDGVVYTHAHADHVHGIDDLRTFVIMQKQRMNIYADDLTAERLRDGFAYCFETPIGSSYPPILHPHRIEHDVAFTIDGAGGALEFVPLVQQHGSIHSLGFRIGDFAYCSDVSAFPEATLEKMTGLDVLIVDALQYREHPSHLSLEQSLQIIERLKPKRAYLTHMHIPLDYETVLRETPDNVEPCYDGLIIKTS